MDLLETVKAANEAAYTLKQLDNSLRGQALEALSKALLENIDYILDENKKDLEAATDLSGAMLKRLSLTRESLEKIASDVIDVKNLDDVVNETIEEIKRPNGLLIKKIRVPFGVIATIFESRPNVTVDISALCIKTGNVVLLKGGKEAIRTNLALTKVMKRAISQYIPENSIMLINDTSREAVNQLIAMKGLVDLVVPRGGKGLINFVTTNSKVPVIETGAGVCHLYVDEYADLDMALKIAINAKTSNPAVCNAVETILVHQSIAKEFLPKLATAFKNNVEIKGCLRTKTIIDCELCNDYHCEYDDLIVSIKIVDSISEAINHINEFGTKHSEAIISNNKQNQELFLNCIDSACVYVNASTRFTDGGCFGFGAELGISTQKLHARGPMGLKEMTTYRYKIYGDGQIR